MSINLGKIEYNKEKVDKSIRKSVPFGPNYHKEPVYDPINFSFGKQEFIDTCEKIGCNYERAIGSIGTVGGGNHFIEIAESTNTGDVWVNIHTGSRNFGALICDYWQKYAKKALQLKRGEEYKREVEKIKETYSGDEIQQKINEFRRSFKLDVDVNGTEWLTGSDAKGYLEDMKKAQEYAEKNRMMIASIVTRFLFDTEIRETKESIESVHNFIDFYNEDYPMIRKVAIRAFLDQRVTIPLSPNYGTLIGRRLGNPDWNYSAPHGAGRKLARNEAKRKLKLEDYERSMEGIFSKNVNKNTLEEAPAVYKDPIDILTRIRDTVEPIDILKPIHCIKEKG